MPYSGASLLYVYSVDNIVTDVRRILQDEGESSSEQRWTETEIIRWLNAGLNELVIHKPNASVSTSSELLTAGSKQEIDGVQLLDITRNMGTSSGDEEDAGDTIKVIPREVMDRWIPDWHYERASDTVKYAMFDERNPKVFWVYPKSTGSNYIEVVQSVIPSWVGSGNDLPIGNEYGNAILDYILYRCYLKDSDHSPNAVKAFSYYQAFLTSLGSQAKVEIIVSPNEKDK